ncbi:PH domain containing protein [Ceratobasidium theobromae]|uniref:PH domain containing protein n=1 Tax=Ceratobasidium theobromae TaxID=1582974 RepID=A0A5N5QA16_9AGAM|nr:PH domain containing protein [Ceratobasidium theobromae]
MQRFPSRESRKPKSVSPIDIIRPRSLSALQPSHASLVVKKVLSLKGSGLFVDTTWHALCDKPADSTRLRCNTSPTGPAWPKDITTPTLDRKTLSAPAPNNRESPRRSVDQPEPSKGSPERNSGYASVAGALPTVPRTPRPSVSLSGRPLTLGGMSMRLSPSVPRPVMPIPILNLPPLPPATPRATPNPPLTTDTIAKRCAQASTVHCDPNGESPQPTLYHQVSQSMMNLSSPPPALGVVLSKLDVIRSPLCPLPAPLVRHNSMPTMVPREEEGKEKLLMYSCGIHIEGMVPRKMEFNALGVLAKDRGEKKQYIALHGTTLSVYKNDVRKFPIRGKVKERSTNDLLQRVKLT